MGHCKSASHLAELKAVYKGRSELLGIEQIIPEDRANGFAQWLQYLGRKEDAIEMFEWNRKTYPHSFNTHLALIKVYSHFELQDAATAAIKQLKQSNIELTSEQKKIVESLSN